MPLRTLKELQVSEQRVLLRVDFNVPLHPNGEIADDTRIHAAAPTIKYLIDEGAKLILITHLGDPSGKPVEELRVDKLAERLSAIIGQRVRKIAGIEGRVVMDGVEDMEPGDIIMLENIRFHPEETSQDTLARERLAQKLAALGQCYVNDAFSVCHRQHASVVDIPKFLPAAAGLLLEKEVVSLGKALKPSHPLVAIIGGAKISAKMAFINNLLNTAEHILFGGALVFTFFQAKGYEIGRSLTESDKVKVAALLLKNPKISLPKDIVVAPALAEDSESRTVAADKIPAGFYGLDIGPKTIAAYGEFIGKAKTIVWVGPMGKFEWKQFAAGTQGIAELLADASAEVIVGGGDTVHAVNSMGLAGKYAHVSTAGSAALDFLEGITLPGIKALEENRKRFTQ
ncbi:phosphoglycerate kinase [Candidatus Woesearchaeota archaeon]|nr:phosphoglycerate kinase [Candidatus Woesearchaeota archaeon]